MPGYNFVPLNRPSYAYGKYFYVSLLSSLSFPFTGEGRKCRIVDASLATVRRFAIRRRLLYEEDYYTRTSKV